MTKYILFCLVLLGCVGGPFEDENIDTTADDLGGTDEPPCATSCRCYSPIMVDLTEGNTVGLPEFLVYDSNGINHHTYNDIQLTTIASGVNFDILGDGTKKKLSWSGPDWFVLTEAFLAIDLNWNGKIDSGAELFGNSSHQVTNSIHQKNGFNTLVAYDTNHDGKIDANDPVWPLLLLWRDYNHDGISTPDELIHVADYVTPGAWPDCFNTSTHQQISGDCPGGPPLYRPLGPDRIVSIGLNYTNTGSRTDVNGNIFWYSAPITWTSSAITGVHHNPKAWDVYLASTIPNPPPPLPPYCGGGPSGGGGGADAGVAGGPLPANDNEVFTPVETKNPANDPANDTTFFDMIQDAANYHWPAFGCSADIFWSPKPGPTSAPVPTALICNGTYDSKTFTPTSHSLIFTAPGPFGAFLFGYRSVSVGAPGGLNLESLTRWFADAIRPELLFTGSPYILGAAPLVQAPRAASLAHRYFYEDTDLWKYCIPTDNNSRPTTSLVYYLGGGCQNARGADGAGAAFRVLQLLKSKPIDWNDGDTLFGPNYPDDGGPSY